MKQCILYVFSMNQCSFYCICYGGYGGYVYERMAMLAICCYIYIVGDMYYYNHHTQSIYQIIAYVFNH